MKLEKETKKISKDSFFNQLRDFGIGPIIGIGISMLTVPITTRLVLPEEFGKSSLFSLIQTIFNLVAFCGMNQAFVRYYNDYKNDLKKLLQNAMVLPLSVCFLVCLFGFIFKKSISFFMFGSYEPLIVCLFLFSLPLLIITEYGLLYVRMNLHGKLYSGLNIFNRLLGFALLMFFLLIYERSFRAIVLGSITGSYINFLVTFLASKIGFIPRRKFFDKYLFYSLLKYGLPLIPSSVLAWVLNSFDKVSLRIWSSFLELGLYAAAFKIVTIMNTFQTIFTTAWAPVAYKWHDERRDVKYFECVGLITLSCFSFVFIGVVLLRNFIFLFLGEAYRNTSEIFVFLFFTPFLYSVSEVTSMGIYFAKKTKYILIISFIAVLINICGDYLLVNIYGARGVAFVTFFSYAVWFWLRTLISRNMWFKFKILPYAFSISLLVSMAFFIFFKIGFFAELILAIISVGYNFYLLICSIKELNGLKNGSTL
ncbi:lipopolysaccharide biosynthesis protein [Treponema sp.]|uniref:lipopolysaccharide biosynthesis protein n=1 Tax=Treponema sp. TaxID=166 RepID=UPI00388EAFFC